MDISLGVVEDAKLMVSMENIPVFAVVDNVKTQVGTGYVDPETMIFTSKLNGSPAADVTLAYLREQGPGAGFVHVTEVTFQLPVPAPEGVTHEDPGLPA